MAVIFNPKFLNQDQQVGKNKCDIKKLKSQVAFICNTQNELGEDATSVLREETDVGIKPIENSLILSRNGNVFKIEATSEDQTILYIRFYASLVGPAGPQGEQGESIVGPEGPQGPRGEAGESIVGPIGPQGPAGQNGRNGTSAGFGTPTASVDSNTGTPSVTITSSGPDTAKVFNFDFHNLKGEQGIQGPQGESIVGPRGPKGDTGQSIVGPQGPRGPKGDNGNSFVVTNSVVSVNELPPASSTPTGTAYFVGGTYPRPVYVVVESEGVKIWQNEGTLQGPEGPQGIQGVPGVNGNDGIGVTFMGAWLSGQTYYYNDCVTYIENGILSSYILINENGITSTTPPPQDTTNWQPSARGVQGPQGPAGQNGRNGTNGTNGTNAGFGTPTASVDSSAGTPSVTITASGPDTAKVFDFAFHNLKGEQGIQGPAGQNGRNGTNGTNGTSAGFGTPTASVDSGTGTPSVTITSSGPDTAKVFDFAFHNLKGATGGTGPQGPSGVVSVATSGSGNNVTNISYDSTTKKITQTKGNCVTDIAGSGGSISAATLGNLILRSSTQGASSGVVTFRTGLSGNYANLQIVWGRVSAGSSNDTSITFTRSFSVVPVVNVTWQKYDNTTREWNLKNDVSTTGFSMHKNAGDSKSYYEYIAIGWSSTASA